MSFWDSDSWAIETYSKHHQGRKRNVEDIDSSYIFAETGTEMLVVAPHAFSSIAIAKWRSLGRPGTPQHPLNGLYRHGLSLVREIRPKIFIFENVARMLLISNGTVREVIDTEFKGMYEIDFYTVDIADFGIPQHRKRALVIGNRLGIKNPEIDYGALRTIETISKSID